MNERIKKLALQYAGKTGTSVLQNAEVLEKFAELMVQECIDVLNKRFMGDLNREDMEVRRCIEAVRNHFGVEE